MNMKLAGGILAVGLAAYASYADGDEPEVPVIKAATFVAGTGNAFLATSWSNNEVPDAFTDIYIDGNTDVDSVANAATNSACSFALHNIKIDKGDHLNLSISSATLSLTANAITNNGSLFISDASSSNDKNITLAAVGGPFYNGPDGVVEVAARRQGNNRTINLRAGGSVNDGAIIIRHTCSTYRDHSKVYLKDDGVFINNGRIQIKSGGKCTKTGSTDLSSSELVLSARQLLLSGTGTVTLDLSDASDTTVRAELNATNYNCEIVNDVNHTIQGEGVIKSMHLLNKGLIRSRGENRALRWEIPGYRDYKLVTTNDVSGRVVAASEKGVSISYPSRPQRNTRFVSFGLMEARAGSVIAFAHGVNSTSDAIPDGDLSPTSGDYLKLWGRIAGGGRFQTIRPIHIMDGARLMPGDLANDDGTGDSTCGTLTFATNLVLEAGAALEEGDGVSSGAITEFQIGRAHV